MKIKVVITGATGMVGEGVLHECLRHPDVASVLVMGRKSCGVQHQKLKEVLHQDFLDISPVESHLAGYNACFFCLGVSSVGMKEDTYRRLTYDLTIEVAETLARLNEDMTFCYVSGASTDSSEKGRSMWARVKGATENRLIRIFPGKAYMFRPGYMHPTPGLKNVNKYYKYFTWMYPALKAIFPNFVCTLREVGLAMIHAALRGFEKPVLEVKDIRELAKD